MMNLLPEKEKKQLRALYRERVMIVGLFLMSAVFMISSVVLSILLFSAKEERAILEEAARLRVTASVAVESNSVEKEVSTVNSALAALTGKRGEGGIESIRRDLFEVVAKVRGPIIIAGLSYRAGRSGVTLDIQGIAPTRYDLVAFSNRLEQVGFSGARVPVSSFVEEKHIPFALSVPIRQ